MGKIEDIERQVQALSAEELAQFRAWFLEFDWPARDHQIARESRRVDSTPSLRRPCATTHPGRLRPFDPPRIPGFLDVLPVLAAGDSEARGRSLCSTEARPTSPVSPFQEGWAILVCSGWCAVSRAGRRDRRRARVVLDWLSCRLRQAARLNPHGFISIER